MDGEQSKPDELHGTSQPPGLPSASNVTPSENGNQGQTITLTEAQLNERIEEAVDKKHGTLDTRIVELTTQLSGMNALKTELDSAKATITQITQDRLNAELEAAKDNPDAYAIVKQRQTLAQKEADLSTREATLKANEVKHQTELTEVRTGKLDKVADALVTEFPGISKNVLLKFGGNTPESMRESAKELHKEFPAGKQPGGQSPPASNTQPPGGNQPPPGQTQNVRPGSGASPGSTTPLAGLELCESELAEAKSKK